MPAHRFHVPVTLADDPVSFDDRRYDIGYTFLGEAPPRGGARARLAE